MKDLPLEQGLSHEKLAKLSGITLQSIGIIEWTAYSIISCLKIDKGIGISLQSLLDIVEKKSKKTNVSRLNMSS
jgi:hypothetical protein